MYGEYMYRQTNYLTILCYIGLTWCFIATTYTVGQYFTLSANEISIQALQSERDIVSEKISALLGSTNNSNLILNELRHRNEQINILRTSLESVNADAKKHARDDILLWFGVTVIFVFIVISIWGSKDSNTIE